MKKIMTTVLACSALISGYASSETLNVSSWGPIGGPLSKAVETWCDNIKEQSDGSLKCRILPKPVAGPAGAFDAIANGVADISYMVDGYTPGRFPTTDVAEFPFTGSSARGVSLAYNDIYRKYFSEKNPHNGVKVLGVFTHAPGTIFSSSNLTGELENLQLKHLKGASGTANELFKRLNVQITMVPTPQLFEMLQARILDGALFVPGAVTEQKLDMIQYALNIEGGTHNVGFTFMMNQKKYDSLSDELKSIIDNNSWGKVAVTFGNSWDKADREALVSLKERGFEWVDASPGLVAEIKENLIEVESQWISHMKDLGYSDPAKILMEMRGLANYYQ